MCKGRCASLLAVCGAALCVIAEADAREPRVRAPAQPLADALSDVARQTDTDVLFTPEAVSGRQAPALDGRMSAEEAITRLLRDHPYADTLARAGHDLVHDRFCIELMVSAVQTIYDEGARAVRPSEVAAAV